MMPVDALPRHGGDLAAAAARFGRPAAAWLDLSTGINPRPYPIPAIAAAAWTRLPGFEAMAALCAAAAARYGTGPDAKVVAAPGTQALIQWLPRLLPPGRVAVAGPTYAEHADAWAAAGHRVSEVADPAESAGADVAIVVNPNNPDGRTVAPASLDDLRRRVGLLVVDEAFADVLPTASVAARAGEPGLVILRSFGKFFGLAGVRLGFALADSRIGDALAAALGPWAVPGPAAAVGTAALADSAWIAETEAWLADAARRLDGLLTGAGLAIVGGTTLYRLARHPGTRQLYEHLGQAGILVRAFAAAPDRLRFGLPGNAGEFQRLERALESWRQQR